MVVIGLVVAAMGAAGGTVRAENSESETVQAGRSASGDSIAGQNASVASSGKQDLDATNETTDTDVRSGDATVAMARVQINELAETSVDVQAQAVTGDAIRRTGRRSHDVGGRDGRRGRLERLHRCTRTERRRNGERR